MKSPYRTNWTALKICAIGGIILCAFCEFLVRISAAGPFDFWEGFKLFLVYIAFLFVGFVFSASTGTFLNRRVTHQVDLKNLNIGQTYWLNGETPAKYVGMHDFTGKYNFTVEYLNDLNNPNDMIAVLPGNVRLYFSTEKEVS